MKDNRTTPMRERMIEDMRIRGIKETTQKGHIRAVKNFAAFLGRPPDTATPDELRAYQLHMTDTDVSTATFNTRIVSLRLFFGVTCGREEMKRYMQFRRKPRKLPVVLSIEEIDDLLAAVPGPGLKYRAALGISYGAGLRALPLAPSAITSTLPIIPARTGIVQSVRDQRHATGWLRVPKTCFPWSISIWSSHSPPGSPRLPTGTRKRFTGCCSAPQPRR